MSLTTRCRELFAEFFSKSGGKSRGLWEISINNWVMAIGLKQEDTIYSFSNYERVAPAGVYRGTLLGFLYWSHGCVICFKLWFVELFGWEERKTPSTTSWSPSLKREAQIPPLRMNQMRNIPIFSGHFTVFLHPPKAEQISLPLEGGGPRSGGRSLLFPHPNSSINHNLKQI